MLFNVSCNNQVFSPQLWKKLTQIHLIIFEKKAKMHTLVPKNEVTKPKARRLSDAIFWNKSAFLENSKTDLHQIFFRILEKTIVHYNLQSALKSIAPSLSPNSKPYPSSNPKSWSYLYKTIALNPISLILIPEP